MTIVYDGPASLHQAVAVGRVAEDITGRGLDDYEVTLDYAAAGSEGRLSALAAYKPEGYFSLSIEPSRDLPWLDSDTVTLVLTVAPTGGDAIVVEQLIESARLAIEQVELDVGGGPTAALAMVGPPASFSVTVPPAPVALAGAIIRDNDPAVPAAGIAVTAGSGSPVESDEAGRFFLDALPVAEVVVLTLSDAGQDTEVEIRPDYDVPVNTITISLDS